MSYSDAAHLKTYQKNVWILYEEVDQCVGQRIC